MLICTYFQSDVLSDFFVAVCKCNQIYNRIAKDNRNARLYLYNTVSNPHTNFKKVRRIYFDANKDNQDCCGGSLHAYACYVAGGVYHAYG